MNLLDLINVIPPQCITINIVTVSGVSSSNFGQISIVIAFHLQIKDFRLGITGFWNQEFVEETLKQYK